MKALSVIGFTEEEVQVSKGDCLSAGNNTIVLFLTHVLWFTTFATSSGTL